MKVAVTFQIQKAVCHVCIVDQSFNNFEEDTVKVSVNETKLNGL